MGKGHSYSVPKDTVFKFISFDEIEKTVNRQTNINKFHVVRKLKHQSIKQVNRMSRVNLSNLRLNTQRIVTVKLKPSQVKMFSRTHVRK